MPKYLFFALALASVSFSLVGVQCPEFHEMCIQEACESASGELTAQGVCIQDEDFDSLKYENEVAGCNAALDYCLENDGVVRNMSCCGPIFILLPALLLALYADGTR